MAEQVKNGKAFEFALAETYYDSIKKLGVPVVLHQDKQYDNCKECLGSFDKDAKNRFKMSALVTVDTLFKLEPGLFADTNQNNPINIRIAKDEEGRNGDVRDVIVYRDSPSWTIGFSAKNNNDAVDTQQNIEDENKNNENAKERDIMCFRPWKQVVLNVDGFITPECLCQKQITTIEKLKSFSEIWNCDIMQEYRKKLQENNYEWCNKDCISGSIAEEHLKFISR